MLIFWNLAGVPLSYCHATLYLANHLSTVTQWTYPSLRAPLLITLFTSYIFIYWIWDTAGSHKHRFRATQRGELVLRKTFPQLPWQTLNNPRVLTTPTGETILIGGWYAYARKIHYTCDVYFALTWGAITGFESPFPWFYPVFFTLMIIHRAYRDIQRCRAKYGETWTEYEKLVPYLFIPVSCILRFHHWNCDADHVSVCNLSSNVPLILSIRHEVMRYWRVLSFHYKQGCYRDGNIVRWVSKQKGVLDLQYTTSMGCISTNSPALLE
jgi:hypothetical protein